MRRNDSLAPKFDETSTFEAFEAEEITSVRARTLPVTSEEVRPYLYLVHEVVGRMLRRLPPSVQRDDLFGVCLGAELPISEPRNAGGVLGSPFA